VLKVLLDWSPVAAWVALVSPPLYAVGRWVWKRYCRRACVKVYAAETVEIGFDAFGPTLALHGTLRAIHGDLFVTRIVLQLTRRKDSSHHQFEWALFRPNHLSISNSELGYELPSSFVLTPQQPHRFNILFHDVDTQTSMQQHLEKLKRSWWKFVEQHQLQPGLFINDRGGTVAASFAEARIEKYHTTFFPSEPHTAAYTAIDRLIYWEPGDYSLCMEVHTESPDGCFRYDRRFQITQEQSNWLRQNSIWLVQAVCETAQGNPRTITARLENESAPVRKAND